MNRLFLRLPHRCFSLLLVMTMSSLAGTTGITAAEYTDISASLASKAITKHVPGLVAAAVIDGKIAYAGATGLRKHGHTAKVTIDDKFHIGSCSKSFTALLAAILEHDGRIAWDSSLKSVFPRIKLHKEYATATLQQLCSNNGGAPADIPNKIWGPLWDMNKKPATARLHLLKTLGTQAPAYKPGSQYIYSNTNFAFAGAMLETVSKSPWEKLIQERIFKPLNMKQAGFRAPASGKNPIDQPYGHMLQKKRVTAVEPEPHGDNPAAIAPAGAIHCSVLDLARYTQFHLGVLGQDLLPADKRQKLYQAPAGQNYALGWIIGERSWADGPVYTHAGSNTMFYAVIWIAPKRNSAFVAMCNLGGASGEKACDNAIAHMVTHHMP